MTYRKICQALENAGVDTPQWDAQLLIEHFCGKDRLFLLGNPDQELDSKELEQAVAKIGKKGILG